ncbi:MAG: creatininase family protein [Alphaproteobacteria bacterium]
MIAIRHWQDLTTEELARLPLGRTVAVLPVGATEQHGPHLPLSVDADIASAVVERALLKLAPSLPVLVLPLMPVGVSPEHADFPGTLTLKPDTFIRMLVEIGESMAAAGVSRLVIVNGHGGQPGAIDLAAQELRRHHGMLVVAVNSFDLYDARARFPADEIKHGIHAGAVETSIMLHLKPASVRASRTRSFASSTRRLAGRYKHLSPQGKSGFAWQAQDLNPQGAVGDATRADAARGRALVEEAASRLAELLAEVSAAKLAAILKRKHR